MPHPPPIRSLALLALLLPVAACSPLTPRETPETALWVPYAQAGIATVHRSTSYVIQRASDTDLLIYEVEDRFLSGNPASRLTWLIQVRSTAPLEKSLEVGPEEGKPASGWLFEQISGKPSHAAPLQGTITISQRSADAVTGVANVYAITGSPTAGEAAGGRVRLARQIEWQRRTPKTIGSKEPETRGGITRQEQQSETAKQPN